MQAANHFKLLHSSGYAVLPVTKGTNATLEPVRHISIPARPLALTDCEQTHEKENS